MTLVQKRKQMCTHYAYTIGERCISWHFYPYNYRIATVVRATKQYWILDDGCKYKKSDSNLTGYVGYADAFIEPVTYNSLKFVCLLALKSKLMTAITNSDDYTSLRSACDILLSHSSTSLPILMMDKYIKDGCIGREV